jgi:integrase
LDSAGCACGIKDDFNSTAERGVDMTNTVQSSKQVSRQPERQKIHELSEEKLGEYQVSERSRFKDEVWLFSNPTPGSKSLSSLNWAMELFDGSRLVDAQHTARLHWSKILMLTLLVLPLDGRSPAPGAISPIQMEFKWFLSWMSECGYHHPHELTPAVTKHYVDQLGGFIAAHRNGGEVSIGVATRAVATLIRLWTQRLALARMGVESLARHPFDGKGAHTVAAGVATKARGWIKPLPDEVAIPMLNKATWFLGTPAEDVHRLMDAIRDPLAGTMTITERIGRGTVSHKAGVGRQARLRRAQRFLETFEFSGPPPRNDHTWHEALDPAFERSSAGKLTSMSQVKELWESVRDAAVVVVQAFSGMRASELLGIKAGIDEFTGLPNGVRLEQSVTGLYEWFVIHTVLSKAEEGLPREVDWVLGMRPAGSMEIPVAVRALCILNRLHEPWRAHARTDRLILSGRGGSSPYVASTAIGSMRNATLNGAIRNFIEHWVDLSGLPDESARKTEDKDLIPWREGKGAIFRTHMLRKAWAQFTLACDTRLLPVIQMQFHHLSLAMTEGGYIGRNPLLLGELNSMAVQKVYLTVFETIIGKTKLAGRMGEQLELSLARLRADAGDLPTSEKWKRAVEWADQNDLEMFFTAHATCCPTHVSEMRCHNASNTPVWLRKAPNTATREPNVCAGCACAIMDKSHEPFWTERYVDCVGALKQAEAAGADACSFREIRFRADQARGILKKFGADLDSLDSRVESMIGGGHASI